LLFPISDLNFITETSLPHLFANIIFCSLEKHWWVSEWWFRIAL